MKRINGGKERLKKTYIDEICEARAWVTALSDPII